MQQHNPTPIPPHRLHPRRRILPLGRTLPLPKRLLPVSNFRSRGVLRPHWPLRPQRREYGCEHGVVEMGLCYRQWRRRRRLLWWEWGGKGGRDGYRCGETRGGAGTTEAIEGTCQWGVEAKEGNELSGS